MLEKAHREDNALDVRTARRDADRDATTDTLAITKKPSAMFLAQGSAREAAVGAEGTHEAATEVPYRAELEQQLGVDLSNLKAHRGEKATAAADALGAEAYAMRDQQAIVFGDANPSKELVAHEVVHALQQGGEGAVSEDEAEADSVAAKVAAGERVDRSTIKGGGGKLRKKEKSNLKKIFEDFLKGAEKDAQERYGDEAEPEEGFKGVAYGGRYEAKSESDESSLTIAGGYKSSKESKHRVGTAETVEDVKAAIGDARMKLATAQRDTTMASVKATFERLAAQTELASLEGAGLEPELIAMKRGLLEAKIEAKTAQIAKLAKDQQDLKHTQTLLDKCEEELPKGLAGMPQRLIDAEKSFRGTETTKKRTFSFNVLPARSRRRSRPSARRSTRPVAIRVASRGARRRRSAAVVSRRRRRPGARARRRMPTGTRRRRSARSRRRTARSSARTAASGTVRARSSRARSKTSTARRPGAPGSTAASPRTSSRSTRATARSRCTRSSRP